MAETQVVKSNGNTPAVIAAGQDPEVIALKAEIARLQSESSNKDAKLRAAALSLLFEVVPATEKYPYVGMSMKLPGKMPITGKRAVFQFILDHAGDLQEYLNQHPEVK